MTAPTADSTEPTRNRGRAGDWINAVVVALVLSIAVLVATIAIAVYDNSALLASRHGTTTSEPPTTGHASGGTGDQRDCAVTFGVDTAQLHLSCLDS